MSNVGIRIYDSSGSLTFSEDDLTLRLVTSFTVSTRSGRKTVPGITAGDSMVHFTSMHQIGEELNVWITDNTVHWKSKVFADSSNSLRLLVFKRI